MLIPSARLCLQLSKSDKSLRKLFVNTLKRNMGKVAVCQVTSTNRKDENLQKFENLVQQVMVDKEIKFLFFPEGVDYIGLSSKNSIEMAEDLDGPTMHQYQMCALKYNIWLSIGGFHEINKEDRNKLFNSHVIINSQGEIVSVYRKLHLFDVNIPEKNINLQESSFVTSGSQIVPPISTPIGNLGLSICYDVRFPELSTCLRKMGAEILTFPSAFTTVSGAAHWESLLRARAIENQCYVIAAAQYGVHNDLSNSRNSYGCSMIVDPWGEIVAKCDAFGPDKPKTDYNFDVATIDLNELKKIRNEMPVFKHRRNDIYSLETTELVKYSPDEFAYTFAHKTIPASTVFYRSKHSFAFTNIRCVVPGHVLVGSLRVAKRLADLCPEEIADLFKTVVRVQQVTERLYNTDSSTVCIQDGTHSGQTMPHVHVHILPRKKGDFPHNDEIYEKLASHDRDANPDPIRNILEMEKEASDLRKLI